MEITNKIIESLNSDKREEFYYKANDVEQELFKLRDIAAEDETLVNRINSLILELNDIRMDGYSGRDLTESVGRKYNIYVTGYSTNEDGDIYDNTERDYFVYAEDEDSAVEAVKDKIDKDFANVGTYEIADIKELPRDEYSEEDVRRAVDVIKSYADTHYRENGYYTKQATKEIESQVNTFILPKGGER